MNTEEIRNTGEKSKLEDKASILNKNNKSNSNTSTTEQDNKQLLKQLELITVSYQMVNVVIFATILSAVNVNKLRLQLIDQLNNTNSANTLPDTTSIPLITSILYVYATYAFALIAKQGLQQQKEVSVNQNSDPLVEAASNGYVASIFVFLASFIRLINVINTSNNSSTATQEIIAEGVPVV